MTKLLGISGSLRKNSHNTFLLAAAAKSFGGDYTLADLNLPLYDGDIEENEGIPAAVQTLYDQVQGADAILISTPEYNGNLSGVLKNALDWISRIKPMPMGDKPVAIMSATAGRAGGVMALNSLRLCLTAFQPRLLHGPLVAVAASYAAFNDDGSLKEESYQNAVDGLMEKLKSTI
ncbi:NAD(P)H-dependent oxidoreductase [Amylibacter sp. IMCC11727]|uniref:NADPH-dependent FMN reductase n=1 Tax=Amylibacter sp. IMCC11727 TaxID=3039851 RepID=UPI00244DF5FD|nr:NAD(P)H-dependent oxidoreductase [Amylibacter sp. IMCC11727]WGI22368.1 NAD(P)H-dependent oxidoreductase [Amylibacter sp. IMCC11727]